MSNPNFNKRLVILINGLEVWISDSLQGSVLTLEGPWEVRVLANGDPVVYIRQGGLCWEKVIKRYECSGKESS